MQVDPALASILVQHGPSRIRVRRSLMEEACRDSSERDCRRIFRLRAPLVWVNASNRLAAHDRRAPHSFSPTLLPPLGINKLNWFFFDALEQ